MTFNGLALAADAIQVRDAKTGRLIVQVKLPQANWSGIATVGDALVLGLGSTYSPQVGGHRGPDTGRWRTGGAVGILIQGQLAARAWRGRQKAGMSRGPAGLGQQVALVEVAAELAGHVALLAVLDPSAMTRSPSPWPSSVMAATMRSSSVSCPRPLTKERSILR